MNRFKKLYRFSVNSLTFEETCWTRFRLIFIGFITGVIVFWIVTVINQYCGDVLGFRFFQQDALVNENRVLHSQLLNIGNQIEVLQKKIDYLAEKNNELRLRSNLPKVDDDLRKMGIGGTEESIDFTSSPSINSLINDLRFTLAKAERELNFQIMSHNEIESEIEKNKVRFMHLPAIKPMEGYYNRNDFGVRLHPILNIYRKHEGVDIINSVGTPVHATADGVVQFTGHRGGYGLTIEINHGFSYSTLYAHLSKIVVREGQNVKRGDLIGISGNTGLSAGPHLHYEVRVNGVAQNPVDYFFDDVKLDDILATK